MVNQFFLNVHRSSYMIIRQIHLILIVLQITLLTNANKTIHEIAMICKKRHVPVIFNKNETLSYIKVLL